MHFISDKNNPAIPAYLRQRRKKSSRGHDEATFPEHRLNHNRCHRLRGHHAAERLIEEFIYLPCRHRSAIGQPGICGHTKRNAVNIRQEGTETLLVRMSLAGKRQAHHGATVKTIFHREHRGTAGKRAGNLHRVLHCFRAAIHQKSLLGEVAGRELVELFRHRNIAFIPSDLEAEMEKGVQLSTQSAQHPWIAMANVSAANSAAQVNEAVAVNILEHRAFSVTDKQRGGSVDPARDGLRPPCRQSARIGPGNFCLKSNAGHSLNTIQSALRSG